jgi:hypothetical protein
MSQYVSKVMTPDGTDPNRESTLELKPPLTREGTVPQAEQPVPQEESLDEGVGNEVRAD